MAVLDFFGEELKSMDFILTTRHHKDNGLGVFRIIGITPKGYLKLQAIKRGWGRNQLQNTKDCIKLPEEQAKKYEQL